MPYDTSQFRKGLKIEVEGSPYVIVDFQHVSPGKGAAFTRTKMKNLLTQNTIERNFRSGEKVDTPDVEQREMQYMYTDAEGAHFMDNKNYEQIAFSDEQLGDTKNWLQEGISASILFYNGKPITVEVPYHVVLTITSTMPGIRGDTVTGGTKPATLETGAVVQVPLHLNEGDKIRVDTRDGSYIEKVTD
ncbi:MAG: elongation factor P [Bdellovibrionales bacterium]|nr:elongation factor P [Bdellovibrionales bacterium]